MKKPPSVSESFLREQLEKSNQVEKIFDVGKSTAFVLKGKRSITTRTKILRKSKSGEVDFEYASGLAIQCKFISSLLKWLIKKINASMGGIPARNLPPIVSGCS